MVRLDIVGRIVKDVFTSRNPVIRTYAGQKHLSCHNNSIFFINDDEKDLIVEANRDEAIF